MQSAKDIQEQACSDYDNRKICTYDVEFIEEVTKPLIHQTARFWFIRKGKAVFKVNGTSYDVEKGCLFCILPWSTTAVVSVEEPLTMVKIVFNSELISNSLRRGMANDERETGILKPIREYPLIHIKDEEYEKFKYIFEEIKAEIGVESVINGEDEEKQDLAFMYVKNKLMELMIMYARHIINKGRAFKDEDIRSEILDYVYSHLENHPSLAQLAEVFGISEEEIKDYIFEMSGMSLSALANEMRISKTTDLLMYTELALVDIAFIVGYTDASHLVRSFEGKTGYTPNKYRQIYALEKSAMDDTSGEKGFNIVSYIGTNYAEDLKQTDVAAHFGVTVIELNKILMYLVERNFENFLNYIRINQASKMLVETDSALIDIAVEVGYNNTKTFTRNFVKLRDMTPGDFRKTYHLQAEMG